MALVKTAQGWKDDSLAADISWGRETAQDRADERASRAAQARDAQESSERIAALNSAAQAAQKEAQKYSSDAALRLYKQKRDDTPSDFNKGGPVIKGEFKHANPTYIKFGNTGDSSLLAKGRK